MEIYRRMVKCRTADQLAQLAEGLADAYGKIPPIVQNMLDLAEIRVRAGEIGISSIVRMDPDIVFSASDMPAVKAVFEGAAGSLRMPDRRTAHWRPPKAYLELPTLITVLLKRFRRTDS